MRHPISKITALALAVPLAGSLLFAPAASAAPVQAGAAVTAADEPYSSFKVQVSAPKKVRAGGKISYTITATNLGPHLADSYWIGGVPRRTRRSARSTAPRARSATGTRTATGASCPRPSRSTTAPPSRSSSS
nr:hypothetical protein GCM10020093_081150 [Planobispora longispora]